MKNFLLLFLTVTISTLQAQIGIDYSGLYSSAPQSSYNGWGGGANFLSAPISIKTKNILFPLSVQLGGGFYVGGAGQKEINDVTLDAAQGPMDISFSNSQMSGYGLARFSFETEGKRRTPYFDLFGGVRSSSASMVMHPGSTTDHEDCTFTSLNRSTGFSGGFGTGILIRLLPVMNLDLGLQWHGSAAPGKFIDMQSVRNTGDGISYNMQNTPAGMLFIKAGIQFRIDLNACCAVRDCKIPSHHKKCDHGK